MDRSSETVRQELLAQLGSGPVRHPPDDEALAAALGFLRGEFVPFGEYDQAAIPVPDGTPTEVVLMEETGNLFPALTALVSDGADVRRVIAYDEIARAWRTVAEGRLSDVRCLEDEDPAYVRQRGDQAVVCWGDWSVPLPPGATWRIRMQDMGQWDDPERTVEILDGDTLLSYADGCVDTISVDASNVTPRWHADAPLEWKVVRRDGIPCLERHGSEPMAIGDANTRVFESGGELFAIDDLTVGTRYRSEIHDLLRRGRIVVHASAASILSLTASPTRLLLTVSRSESEPEAPHASVLLVSRHTGSIPTRPPGQPTDALWFLTGRAKRLDGPNGAIVIAEMARDDAAAFANRGVRVMTGSGENFYPLRGVAFDALQLVDDALWGWRRAPGGIVLSRYPLPRD